MRVEYETSRVAPEEEANVSLEVPQRQKAGRHEATLDLDEADLADSFELPGADLSNEDLLIQVVPVQPDEFTCMCCFLVHHRSQLAREKDGKKYCSECES